MEQHQDQPAPPPGQHAPVPVKRVLPKASTETRSAVLSNGAVAMAREVTGAELIKAQRMVDDGATNMEVSMALASLVTTVDGERFAWEELKEVSGGDVQEILSIAMGNAPSPKPET